MTHNLSVLPTGPNVDKAWNEYTALLHEAIEDRDLANDADHLKRIAIAEEHWRTLFEKWAGVKHTKQSAAS